ncbi:hypothetical protein BH11ARM2_BH11ARM2_04800 [soil metagenome]
MAFDLDSASKSLREEPTPLPRVLPTRRGARPLRWAAPLAAGIAVFVLWPRTGSAAAWAQVAANSRQQKKIHVRSMKDGKLFSERWQDGNRLALDVFDKIGKLSFRVRLNGSRYLSYLDHQPFAWTYPAEGDPGAAFHSLIFGRGTDTLEELLKSDGVHEVEPAKPEGDLVRYRLEWKLVARPERVFRNRFDALVEPKSGQLRRMEYLRDGKVTLTDEIEYPDSVPAEKFALVPPPGIKALDAEAALRTARVTLRQGVAFQKVAGRTITLRGLFSGGNDLNILWTGTNLPSDGRFPATLDGTSIKVGYGIAALSSKPEKDTNHRPAVYGGLPVRGQTYWSQGTIASRYTVRIPVLKAGRKVGEAVFPNVPVMRIPNIYGIGNALLIPSK